MQEYVNKSNAIDKATILATVNAYGQSSLWLAAANGHDKVVSYSVRTRS